MNPDREGLFHAYPADIGVDETGPNKLATVVIEFTLFEELVNGGWVDCSPEGLSILGYFYLEKKDGSVNTHSIDALKASLGWDGRDPFWLQENDLSQHPVQIKLGNEQYEGRQRLKVLFLNTYGASGQSVPKGDDKVRHSIQTRLGGKLRAHAGGTPAPAPTPAPRAAQASQPPKAAALPPKKSAPPARSPQATATLEQAWEEFTRHCNGEKWTQEAIENEWFRIIAEMFPGKQPDELSGVEWAVMLAQGPGNIIPF